MGRERWREEKGDGERGREGERKEPPGHKATKRKASLLFD